MVAAIAEEQTQFRPAGFSGKLTPYDLEQVFEQEKRKASAGKPYNYSSFLVKEFSEHYYPKGGFQWHYAGRTRNSVGIRKKDMNTVEQVFVRWTSYSDGLEWGFFNGQLERTTKPNLFAIIPDLEVEEKIKQSLIDRELLRDEKEASDVFRYRTRTLKTAQRTSNLRFPKKELGPVQYGVLIGDQVYFFTAQGEETN